MLTPLKNLTHLWHDAVVLSHFTEYLINTEDVVPVKQRHMRVLLTYTEEEEIATWEVRIKKKEHHTELPTLTKLKNASSSESFRNSFKEIEKCLKQIGKEDLFIDIQREKQALEKHHFEEGSSSKTRNLEKKVKDLEQTLAKQHHLMKELDDVKQQNRKLMREIKIYRPEDPSATVQLFHIHEGNTINEIKMRIKAILENKLGTICFIDCQSASDIEDDMLLIVPYIVTTRVGADADIAIADVPNPRNTALLLIHNKEPHSLPKQMSSGILTEQKFKALRGLYDLAFTTGNGFYHCGMNSTGIDALYSFCRQHPVEHRPHRVEQETRL